MFNTAYCVSILPQARASELSEQRTSLTLFLRKSLDVTPRTPRARSATHSPGQALPATPVRQLTFAPATPAPLRSDGRDEELKQLALKQLAARPSPIPSPCTQFTRAGIEWRRCHRAACMARSHQEHHRSVRAGP